MANGIAVPEKYSGRVKRSQQSFQCTSCFDTGLVIFGENILGARDLLRKSAPCACVEGDQWKAEYRTFAMIDLLCSKVETGVRLDKNTIQAIRSLPLSWTREMEAHFNKIPYREFLRTNYWAVIKAQVLAKAEWKCQNCPESILANLSVHHRSYAVLGAEWKESNEWALRCLCCTCHHSEHEIARGLEEAKVTEEPSVDIKAAFEKLLDKCSMNGGQHKLDSWSCAKAT